MFDSSPKLPQVYILASAPNGTLYVGVTSNLFERMCQHRDGTFGGFTKRYGVKVLVYHETFATMKEAIRRESQIKKWRRLWKIRLIEEVNPTWSNLFDVEEGVEPVGRSGQEPRC